MTSPSQRAGSRWEEDCARYLREEGGQHGAERIRVKHPDRGDIGGVTEWTIECKGIAPGSGGRFDMAAAMNQLAAAQKTTGTQWGVMIRKRKQAGPERAYAVMELRQFVRLMRIADDYEALAAQHQALR
jgi:hypothetical protein